MDLPSLDECDFQQDGTRCRMWGAPEIKDPVVLHALTRKSVAGFGAVNPFIGQFIRHTCTVFNMERSGASSNACSAAGEAGVASTRCATTLAIITRGC